MTRLMNEFSSKRMNEKFIKKNEENFKLFLYFCIIGNNNTRVIIIKNSKHQHLNNAKQMNVLKEIMLHF
jgi:hypothetical protein